METTYKLTATEQKQWKNYKRLRITARAKAKARQKKATVVTIETPKGLILDVLQVTA